MAKTAFATTDLETKEVWEEQLFREMVKESYFSKFMGTSQDSMVYVNDQLTKSAGDRITFTLRARLTGSGVTSGVQLEGNEERINTYTMQAVLEEYAHGVRDAGPLDRQRVFFSIDTESVNALKDWGSEKIDSLLFSEAFNSPTKIFYGGTATTTANITSSDKIDTALINKMKTWAKTGGNRSISPIRPLKVDGKEYYILLTHEDVLADLFVDSTFYQARRDAEIRGKENPIFSGAYAIWNGCVVHTHENVPLYTTWGSGANLPGSKILLLGAQALCWGNGKRPSIVSKNFDYDREHGFAWSVMGVAKKSVFNSKDFGIVEARVYRTKVSDA